MQKEKHEILSFCRLHKDDTAAVTFRRLLRLRFEELRDKLLSARGDEALEVRGAALELKELLHLVEHVPPDADLRDGAYT